MKGKMSKGVWRVEQREKSLLPFVSNGVVKIADVCKPQAIGLCEARANAELIASAPILAMELKRTNDKLKAMIDNDCIRGVGLEQTLREIVRKNERVLIAAGYDLT